MPIPPLTASTAAEAFLHASRKRLSLGHLSSCPSGAWHSCASNTERHTHLYWTSMQKLMASTTSMNAMWKESPSVLIS